MKPSLVPLGDAALLVQFGGEIELAVNRRIHALDARIRAHKIPGVIETVPAYTSLLLHYDPLVLTYAQVVDWVKAELPQVDAQASSPPRRIEVPVRYGGEDGPDLEFVAAYHRLSTREVASIHAGREYTVYMMGFTPGFPYMGKLEEAIATPRLETPRTHVAAGSVGIAGAQTGIYPIASPGGWRIIGRTALGLFEPEADQPFLFAPGDTVQFVIEALDA
jgi:KipI family sensor histidine kinase inhibitor